MKVCTKCNFTKQETEFAIKGKGRSAHCKQCQRLWFASHYQKNKDQYIARTKKSNPNLRQRNREYFNNYKRERGCNFCPEKEPVALDFHHLDSSEKEKNICRMINGSLSIETIMHEVSKCLLVCSNCHRKIHAGLILV